MPDGKDVSDVLAPLPVVQGGLARIGFGAHHACRIGGDAGGFGYAPCYPIALIIAPLPFLFRDKGMGTIRSIPLKNLWLSVPRPSCAPWFSRLRDGYGISVRTKCGCEESVGCNGKRNSFLDGNQSPKYAGDVVFFKRDGPDTWEVGLTSYTEHLFTRRHAPAATKAIPGKEKVQKGLEVQRETM